MYGGSDKILTQGQPCLDTSTGHYFHQTPTQLNQAENSPYLYAKPLLVYTFIRRNIETTTFQTVSVSSKFPDGSLVLRSPFLLKIIPRSIFQRCTFPKALLIALCPLLGGIMIIFHIVLGVMHRKFNTQKVNAIN